MTFLFASLCGHLYIQMHSNPFVPQNLHRFLLRVPAILLLLSATLTSFLTPGCFPRFASVCLFTFLLSSFSLCLRFLSRSIVLHSSSISGHGGKPCSSRSRHLSIWTHRGRPESLLYSFHSVCAATSCFNSILPVPWKTDACTPLHASGCVWGVLQAYIDCGGSSDY